jgi:hypothetical protein
MTLRAKLLHPATAIALLALVIAAGGPSWATTLVGTGGLRTGAVTTAKLAPGSVTTPKIRAGAVTTAKLARGAVQGRAIFDGAITTSKLGRGAVDAGALAAGAVGTAQLALASVGAGQIADGSVDASKLVDGAVTSAKLGPNAVTADRIADGQVVEGRGTLLSNRLVLPSGAGAPVLEVTGLGTIAVSCLTGIPNLRFTNTTGGDVNVQVWDIADGTPDLTSLIRATPAAGAGFNLPNGDATTGNAAWTIQASATDAAGTDHVATVHVSSGITTGACIVAAQGVSTG